MGKDLKVSPIEALFFDLDDTLLDYPLSEGRALDETLSLFSPPWSREEFLSVYHGNNLALWRGLERGEVDFDRLRTERFTKTLEELGSPGIDPLLFAALYEESLGRQVDTLPGAEMVIERLSRRYPMALITNGISSIQRSRLARSPWSRYFSQVVISEEVGVVKPDPAILKPALESLNLEPSRVLFIGDSVLSDMACAERAGMPFAWFTPRPTEEPPNARYLFRFGRLEELLSRL